MSEEMNNNEQVQTNEETLNQVKESVVENLEESSVKELDACAKTIIAKIKKLLMMRKRNFRIFLKICVM